MMSDAGTSAGTSGAASGGTAAVSALFGDAGAGGGTGTAGGGAPAQAASPGAAAAGAAAGEGEAGQWWEGFNLSAERPDADTMADKEWLANKNFPTPQELVKAYRNLEKAKPILLPKGPDDADGRKAALMALGLPADAKDYDIPVPDGQDTSFAEAFRPEAHKLGLLPDQVKGLVSWYNETVMGITTLDADTARAALEKEWGGSFAENHEMARRGRDMLKLDEKAVAGIASGYGLAETVKLMAKIGRSVGEAGGLPGGGGGGFVKTPAQLEARRQEIMASPELQKKILAKDPGLTAEWQAIIDADAMKMKETYQS